MTDLEGNRSNRQPSYAADGPIYHEVSPKIVSSIYVKTLSADKQRMFLLPIKLKLQSSCQLPLVGFHSTRDWKIPGFLSIMSVTGVSDSVRLRQRNNLILWWGE